MIRFSGARGFIVRTVNLHNALLYDADLQNANLSRSNLSGANLTAANLSGADLRDTNLQNANLSSSSMVNALLGGIQFNGKTYLPDGQLWTSDTDMSRYTNPEHPDFWQPEWAKKSD